MSEQETALTQTAETEELEANAGNEWVDTAQSEDAQTEPGATETPAEEPKGLTAEEQSAKDKAYAEAERERLRAEKAEAELAELRRQQYVPPKTTEQTADPELDEYAAFLDSKVDSEEISAYQAKQYLAEKKAELNAKRAEKARFDRLEQTVLQQYVTTVGTPPQQEFKSMLADANVGGVAAVPGSELHNEIVAYFKARGVDINNPAAFVTANGQPISPEYIQGEVLAAKLLADYRVKSRNKPRAAQQTPPLPVNATTPQPQNSKAPSSFEEATARLRAEYPG